MNRTATQLAPDVFEQLTLTVDHLNASHADTVLFIARGATDLPTATDAELLAIDGAGADVDMVVGGQSVRARIRFDRSVTTVDEIRGELLGRLRSFRAAAPADEPLTSLERELATTASLPTFVTTVHSRRLLSPNLCEIVFDGGLDELTSNGGDQFVYVIAPRPGAEPIPDGYTMAAHQADDSPDAPRGAYYTVRRWDRDASRLTIWAVLHGHPDGVGAWAASCGVGDRVAIWGPRHGVGSSALPGERLVVADESGFAAVAALIEELPPGSPTTVILETVDRLHEIDLPGTGSADVTVVWCHRGDDAPGTGSRLLDAVRELDIDATSLVAFGALESRQATSIRTYLRHELELPAERVSFTGYWRR